MPYIDVWLYDYATDTSPIPWELLTVEEHRRPYPRIRGTLRKLLRNYTQTTHITRNPYGKPHIDGVHFNLAHTARYALYAFSPQFPLGVDVEALRPHHVEASMLLHPAERMTWDAIPHDERQRAFFNLWVRKEALLKAEGGGLTREPHSVHVGIRRDPPNPIENRWTLRDLPTPVGWAAALAYEAVESQPVHIRTYEPRRERS